MGRDNHDSVCNTEERSSRHTQWVLSDEGGNTTGRIGSDRIHRSGFDGVKIGTSKPYGRKSRSAEITCRSVGVRPINTLSVLYLSSLATGGRCCRQAFRIGVSAKYGDHSFDRWYAMLD